MKDFKFTLAATSTSIGAFTMGTTLAWEDKFVQLAASLTGMILFGFGAWKIMEKYNNETS